MQENHTFDSYFGAYCLAPARSNPTCTTGPGCCEGAPTADPRGSQPYGLDDALNTARDPLHSQQCELAQINGGLMNQFTAGSGIAASLVCSGDCSEPRNFAIARGSVPLYWGYASISALGDRYFHPIAGGTSSNDVYFADAAYHFIDNAATPGGIGSGCLDPLGVCLGPPVVSYAGGRTIADLLLAHGVGFRVYADGYGEARDAYGGVFSSCASVPSYCPWSSILHPVLARSCLYDPSDIPFQYFDTLRDRAGFIVDSTQFVADVAAHRLPEVSYLKARTFRNEHPEFSTISDGMRFTASMLQPLLNSSYATDTLILLTWDEGGGFFDHVPPPAPIEVYPAGAANAGRPVPYGTRVPVLALGVFSRTGQVSHVQMEHSSIVRFLEFNFLGPRWVGALGNRDARVNNIGSLLDPTRTGVLVPDR